jgi:hypothetical protein
MGDTVLDANGVKALAELPSLDELRAKIVGLIQAPATKIARTIAEPAPCWPRASAPMRPKKTPETLFFRELNCGPRAPNWRLQWQTFNPWLTSFPN